MPDHPDTSGSSLHPVASAIATTWRRNGAYASRLVSGLTPLQWSAQPVATMTMNHPAWIFSHLNLYAAVCVAMLRGIGFDDPTGHRFGPRSEVGTDPAAYRPGDRLLEEYTRLHGEAETALAAAAPSLYSRATPLERWRAMCPTTGDMLVTLMVKHESHHLGQLSAWRRALGMPPVPM